MYQVPRGTTDLLPTQQKYWRYVETVAANVCKRIGYERIDTPIFEASGLFVRSVGAQTDIVQKEMYTFDDRGGDSLTLRPEGTAPVCRAYLEHGMSNLPQPVRLYYFCPIFRYERPQAGRYREHHQFGIEAIGDPDPTIDAEVIQIGWSVTQELGLENLSLVVNSIGDSTCKPNYLKALRNYYETLLDNLCNDCHNRYQHNPLRLLDCKQDTCQPYIKEAPRSLDYLCEPCKDHWETLLGYLENLRIPFKLDHRLVRGLDYYTRTVFEIQPPEEGSQNTIVGGGRYDGLIEQLGGKSTPGVGFGSGFERIIMNLIRQEIKVPDITPRPTVIVHRGPNALGQAVKLAQELRDNGITTVLAPAQRSLRAQMRYASSMNARFALILGDDELANGTASVRDMDATNQEDVLQEHIGSYLQEKLASRTN
ncbi:MAG: histidine--tRNA ligase [SAR202 cluster bacterium Io17-Chloro-G3]|nr:MAG: histidine--tRNA ligase [SAR202 cluster bacterium Io17-Chloro-G3]